MNSAASGRLLGYARRCHAVRRFRQWELVPKLATDLKAPNRAEDSEHFARRSHAAAMWELAFHVPCSSLTTAGAV